MFLSLNFSGYDSALSLTMPASVSKPQAGIAFFPTFALPFEREGAPASGGLRSSNGSLGQC